MSLREELEQDIDEARFDAVFDALFIRPADEITSEFYDQELGNACRQSPLLERVAERVDDLILGLRGRISEEQLIGLSEGRAIACVAIAAYISSEVGEPPES